MARPGYAHLDITNGTVSAISLSRETKAAWLVSEIPVQISVGTDQLTVPNNNEILRHSGNGGRMMLKLDNKFKTLYVKRTGSDQGHVELISTEDPLDKYVHGEMILPGAKGEAGAKGLKKVGEHVLTDVAQDLLVTVALTTGKTYILESVGINAYNGALTVTQRINGSSVGAAIETIDAQHENWVGNGTLNHVVANSASSSKVLWDNAHDTSQQTLRSTTAGNTNDLTSIGLRASQVGGFAAGSFLRVWSYE